MASRTASAPWVLLTAINLISCSLRFAPRAAFRIRSRMTSRFAAIEPAGICVGMKVETIAEKRGKLARYALQLNARSRADHLPHLILMTDDRLAVAWVEAVSALPAGAGVIVRHRDRSSREALARVLLAACRIRGVKLLIADDLKLAVRLRADGVHIPQAHHAHIAEAQMRSTNWLVTASAHDPGSVVQATRAGADAVIVSPLFNTRSHADARGLGISKFQRLAQYARIPVYALGGINSGNVHKLTDMKLAGIALINGWV